MLLEIARNCIGEVDRRLFVGNLNDNLHVLGNEAVVLQPIVEVVNGEGQFDVVRVTLHVGLF